tara:strand:+ start:556 stop:1389 length:834 start_codon:yes stop_codon:yes gene_type:complete
MKKLDFEDWYCNTDRETLVMGVLNITPDSFSDGGLYLKQEEAIKRASYMLQNGADIIDIGGESSRPGAEPIDIHAEIERVIPIIQEIRVKYPNCLISIDSYKPAVVRKAIIAGANIINDISGLTFDNSMIDLVIETKVPIIIMHMKGTPQNMQLDPKYDDLLSDVLSFFRNQIKRLEPKNSKIILDPGIGFGKTLDHNFSLIKNLGKICDLGFPVLIGPSRKSFIGHTLNLPVEKRIEGTAASVCAGILNGARIIRVHDVMEMKRVVTITEKIITAI